MERMLGDGKSKILPKNEKLLKILQFQKSATWRLDWTGIHKKIRKMSLSPKNTIPLIVSCAPSPCWATENLQMLMNPISYGLLSWDSLYFNIIVCILSLSLAWRNRKTAKSDKLGKPHSKKLPWSFVGDLLQRNSSDQSSPSHHSSSIGATSWKSNSKRHFFHWNHSKQPVGRG